MNAFPNIAALNFKKHENKTDGYLSNRGGAANAFKPRRPNKFGAKKFNMSNRAHEAREDGDSADGGEDSSDSSEGTASDPDVHHLEDPDLPLELLASLEEAEV